MQDIIDRLGTSPNIVTFFPSLNDEIKSLINDCHKIVRNSSSILRKLQQNVQRCLTQRKHNELIQAIETYCNNYPIGIVARQAVTMVKKVILYCDRDLSSCVLNYCEYLQSMTADYNDISLDILPLIKLHIKEVQIIHSSLHTGSPDIEATKLYFVSGKYAEEKSLIRANSLIKLQKVAPNYVKRLFQKL